MSKENNNLMSDIPENERTADETGHGFDINAWRALPFLRKIETADKPLKWLVVMPSLLALYGCLFYVIANSCVYYPEIVPVRAFLFQDVFMLVLLVLMALDVLVALVGCTFLYRFKRTGIKFAYLGFAIHGLAHVFWIACMLIAWKSFYGWGLVVCLLLLAFLGLVFLWNVRYFTKRKHLFL